MSFYPDMAVTADALIREFGQTVTIKRIATGAYDPATGSATTNATTQTGFATVMDFGIKDIDGTLIKTGDKRMLLSALGIVAPQVDDVVSFGSSSCVIKNVNAQDPAGIAVYYDIQMRGM